MNLKEISSDLLRKAKHKAYALSSKADQEGKTKEADKRFSQGIKFQNREYDVSKKEGDKLSKYMAQKEAVTMDTGWQPSKPKKDIYGNLVKKVAKHLAKQGMQQTIDQTKNDTAIKSFSNFKKKQK